MPSIMVLTGISQISDLDDIDYAPTWIMQDLREVTKQLKIHNHD